MSYSYRSIVAMWLMVTISYSGASYATEAVTAYRLDSNQVITQQLDDGRLRIDFFTHSDKVTSDAALRINNMPLTKDTYRFGCQHSENPSRCVVLAYAVNPAALQGKFMLTNAAGDIIVAGENRPELTFASDSSDVKKLKITNLLDREVRIVTIDNQTPVAGLSIAPLSNTTIAWPESGAVVLECMINGENLIYMVQKTSQSVNTEDVIGFLMNNKTIVGVAAGGVGALTLVGSISTWLQCSKKRLLKISQETLNDKITKIEDKIAKARLRIEDANNIVLWKCSAGKRNAQIKAQVQQLVQNSEDAIVAAFNHIKPYRLNFILRVSNLEQAVSDCENARDIVEEACTYAEEAVIIAKQCSNDEYKQCVMKIDKAEQEEASLKKTIELLQQKLNEVGLNNGIDQAQQQELERQYRESVAQRDEQSTTVEQTRQELNELLGIPQQQQAQQQRQLTRDDPESDQFVALPRDEVVIHEALTNPLLAPETFERMNQDDGQLPPMGQQYSLQWTVEHFVGQQVPSGSTNTQQDQTVHGEFSINQQLTSTDSIDMIVQRALVPDLSLLHPTTINMPNFYDPSHGYKGLK